MVKLRLISVRFILGSGIRTCYNCEAHIFALTQTEAEQSLHLINIFITMFHQTLASSDVVSVGAEQQELHFSLSTLIASIGKVYN